MRPKLQELYTTRLIEKDKKDKVQDKNAGTEDYKKKTTKSKI